VKLAEDSTGQQLAIKVFKNNHALAANVKALANEIKVMQQINHPNLVNLIDYQEAMPYVKKNGKKEQRVCIVMELAKGGELFEYVAQTGRFNEETSRFYFR
jgi:serine/threonine protein kinase